jgi:hypothetical protein
MRVKVAMPAVRQNRSKLTLTCCQASSTIAVGTAAGDVVDFFMALLSFADSTPRAYRLKVSNACPPISTSTGTSPEKRLISLKTARRKIEFDLRASPSNECTLCALRRRR